MIAILRNETGVKYEYVYQLGVDPLRGIRFADGGRACSVELLMQPDDEKRLEKDESYMTMVKSALLDDLPGIMQPGHSVIRAIKELPISIRTILEIER